MKRITPVLASLAILAACGSGTSAPTETLPADALVIKAVPSIRFDAAKYGPVPAGEVLIGYQNLDSVRHTLILAKDGEKVANFKLVVNQKGNIDSGAVTLEKGTYSVICDVPGHSNMKATLEVE